MTKSKNRTAAKIRGKRRCPAQSAPMAEAQGEVLPAEDTYERALASVKTERSRAFVQELVRTWPQLDGKAAALAVGCSPGIAKKTASIWRHRPDIARAVDLWIKERVQKSLPPSAATPEQQAEEVLRTAWLMARANVLWFTRISPDRELLIPDFSHATDEMLACIEAFDISERGIKLRLKDSSKALTLLARATGVDRPEMKLAGDVVFRVVYEQTPERLSRELGELNPDHSAEPDEAQDDSTPLLPVKKFRIN
jgi:hypothetical protein